MKTYIISIFITVILISLAQIILPKGKISVAATGILSFVMIFCFLKPLNTLSFDVGTQEEQTNESLQADNIAAFNDFVDRSLEKYYSTAFKEVLKENDLICERVVVEICDKNLTKTEIYLSNPVMSDDSEHININVITDYVANFLGLQREIVTVYG